ncbi:UNVERIFIED_CONTAM: hypothetical protein RMT77_011347 [Armadillidium vulgare]
MTKKIPNIIYNLSQNIIRYNQELESLKNYSLNLFIGKLFKKSIDPIWIKRIANGKGFNPTRYKEWRKVEEKIDDQVFEVIEYVPYYFRLFPHLIKSKIHFMGMQILDSLTKHTYLYFIDASDILPCFVFTCQGTIDTLKSVERVWMESYITSYYNFRITCYLFSEKDIKLRFQSLSEITRKNVIARSAGDYILKFWLQKIQINNNTLLKETLDEYNLDGNFDNDKIFYKAIETNNEIAVEYLWTNEISQMEGGREILLKALKMIVDNSMMTNIMMYLLFQVNENEFEEFFQSSSLKIIENIVKEVRWHCLFDKIFDVLKIYFSSESVSKIFYMLIDSVCKDYPTGVNLDLVVNYFRSLPESDKIYILRKRTSKTTNLLSLTQENKCSDEKFLWKSFIREYYLEKLLKVEESTTVKEI